MRQLAVIPSLVFALSITAVAAAVPLQVQEPPVALARGGSGTMCHCPCRTLACDCTMHGETCHRCFGLEVRVTPYTLDAMLASPEPPVLESSDADWFEAAPHPEINVRLLAPMARTGQAESMRIRFVPDPLQPSRYVPDGSFDPRSYAAWARRVDRSKTATLQVGAKDDPATWRILEGGAERLNQSLEKSFQLVRREGSRLEVFRSESTLGWEANLYLRSVVAGIPDAALQGSDARSALLSLVDLVDLQVKAGDVAGAIGSLDRLIEAGESRWLAPSSEDSKGALCGFRKIRNLLAPGSSTSCS